AHERDRVPALLRAAGPGGRDPSELQGLRVLVEDAARRPGAEAGLPAVLLSAHAVVAAALPAVLLDHRPRADPGADRHARPRDRQGARARAADQGPHPPGPGEKAG